MTKENIVSKEFKRCECSPDCPEFIPMMRNKRTVRRFKYGHQNKGKNHPKYGKQSSNWKGGRKLHGGYWHIYKPDHPFCNFHGYVYEHRLVMEEYLGRYLTEQEEIHHLDCNRENNRIGNLMLFANHGEHSKYEMGGTIRIDMSTRYCFLCGSTETYITKKGRPHWLRYQNGIICYKCYKKIRRWCLCNEPFFRSDA